MRNQNRKIRNQNGKIRNQNGTIRNQNGKIRNLRNQLSNQALDHVTENHNRPSKWKAVWVFGPIYSY
jgi:hypothetical protein